MLYKTREYLCQLESVYKFDSMFVLLNQSDWTSQMAESINIARIGKKLGIILLGMVIFLLLSMWIKGVEFKFRVFMALFAGLSAWMGIFSLVVWLWKESRQNETEQKKGARQSNLSSS
jgi:hypothetical protein